MEKQAGATGDVTAWGRSDGRTKHRIGPSWHPSAVSDGAIRARHVPRGLCLSTPSGVVGAHVDGLLQVTWQPGCLDIYPIPQTLNTKQTSAQPVESAGKDRPARAESTRAPGTITKTAIVPMTPEGAGSQKGLRFQTPSSLMQTALITLTTPHHGPRATATSLRSLCNSAPCKGPIRDEKGFA